MLPALRQGEACFNRGHPFRPRPAAAGRQRSTRGDLHLGNPSSLNPYALREDSISASLVVTETWPSGTCCGSSAARRGDGRPRIVGLEASARLAGAVRGPVGPGRSLIENGHRGTSRLAVMEPSQLALVRTKGHSWLYQSLLNGCLHEVALHNAHSL